MDKQKIMQFEQYDRKIVLEDGTEFYGRGFGSECERVCELVFNTAMLGYQEIISDPAYTYQAVVMTYPIIGNYGTCDDDFESKVPTIGGLVVREYNDVPSNFRTTKTLNEVMEDYNIPGIEGLDTRVRKAMKWIGEGSLFKHVAEDGQIRLDYEPTGAAVEYVYGDPVGYVYTDFICTATLMANAGDSVVTILDKINKEL